jgi:RNA polymerase sigma-70 factor (ECF subfamily)
VSEPNDWRQSEERWSAWLARAQDGDSQAYASLLRELKGAIRAYLISRFGYSDTLDDCVQECLLAIHEARHTYDVRRPVRPWLFAIVRHRTIDFLRKHKPRAMETTDLVAHEPDWAVSRDGEQLLARLSATLREPLLLTKFFGLTTRECAARLGVSESVVKVRVFRGIRKLRAMWEAEAS